MVRRLSITVPDELWDSLTYLDQSPSGLVQRALRCLHDVEGSGSDPTAFESAAGDIPYWESVVDNLSDQATELRAEGYEAMIMAMHEGSVGLHWLEWIATHYALEDLPPLMSQAADVWQSQRCTWGNGASFLDRPVFEWEVDTVLFGEEASKLNIKWDEDHRELIWGVCKTIVIQKSGLLSTECNSDKFQLSPDQDPTTDIPLSLWEGMAAAIFDVVATVRRRVRTESNPARLGSYRQ
jgi:hypothetical protein